MTQPITNRPLKVTHRKNLGIAWDDPEAVRTYYREAQRRWRAKNGIRKGGPFRVKITAHMCDVIVLLLRHKNAMKVASLCGVGSKTIAQRVASVEAKIGRRLFTRRCGSRNSTWVPQADAHQFFLWCVENPMGGADYPRGTP